MLNKMCAVAGNTQELHFIPQRTPAAALPQPQHRPCSLPCWQLPACLEDPARRKPHFLAVTPAIPTPPTAHHYVAKPSPLVPPSPRSQEALHCFNLLCGDNEGFPFCRAISADPASGRGGFHAQPARRQQDGSGRPSHRLHAPACVCFSLVVVKAGGMAGIAQPDSGLDGEDPSSAAWCGMLSDDNKQNIGWGFSGKTSSFQQKSPRFSLDQNPGDSGTGE